MAVITKFTTLPKPINEAWTAFDALSVCNLILDEMFSRGPTTVLMLQKLAYFAHGQFLTETGLPLVYGTFVAWQLGPSHPAIKMSFGAESDRPINYRALTWDPLDRWAAAPQELALDRAVDCVKRIVRSFGSVSVDHLIDLACAPGAPWHFVVKKAKAAPGSGLRIRDSYILQRFKYHKISVDGRTSSGAVDVTDAPFA